MSHPRRFVLAAVAALACLAGCARTPPEGLGDGRALSPDGRTVYAVDAERDRLQVLDRKSGAVRAEVAVGRAPEHVVVAPDGRVFVSNRGSRSVSVIQPGTWREARRVPVGVEPVGLALAQDGKTLYVVNSVSLDDEGTGTLSAVDLATLTVRWELPVGPEPRAVTLLGPARARISFYRSSATVEVDLTDPEVPRLLAQALAAPLPSVLAAAVER